MAMVETAALGVAKVVGTRAGSIWLAQRTAASDRDKDLTELMRLTFRDTVLRRRVELQLEGIALSVADRLLPLCEQEFRGLDDADRAAVLAELTDTLERADLSDQELLGADLDPAILIRRVRARMPRRDRRFEFGEAGARLFEILLEECCEDLVRIVVSLPQFPARASAEALSRLTGLADQVSAVLSRLPQRSLDAPEGMGDDEEFGRRYAEHISRTLDQVELFGVRVRRYRPRTSLSVAYISLSVSAEDRLRPARDQHYGHLPLAGELPLEAKAPATATMRVESALGDRRRTLIRGEAGSGKSTLLRWLAITAVRGRFDSDLEAWNGFTPFLIKLRSHAKGALPGPERFLEGVADSLAELMPRGWVHRRLSSGRALLLVDGVDELSAAQRRRVPGWLRDLLATFPGLRVVVTSRPAAASARWLEGESFGTAHLVPMGASDLRELVGQWHQAISTSPGLPCEPEALPRYEAELLARLESAPHLRSLASTPLLAAMLCALNLDHATRLPRDRMGLYAATLTMLLDRRDDERDIPAFRDLELDYEQKLRMLQGLAWRLSSSQRSELPKSVALREVEERAATMHGVQGSAETLMEYLLERSGVLREPVDGRLNFAHRTIQEYLTAKQAVYDHDIEYLVARAHLAGWRETVIMAAGHANGPQLKELLGGILTRMEAEPRHARYLKLLLAAFLETASTVPAELREAIHGCVDDLVPPRDKATARSLSTAGEVVLEMLPESLDGLTDKQAVATVRAATLVNGSKALNRLAGYKKDPRSDVQEELQDAWKYFDPDEYARRVLADTLLEGSRLTVDSHRQLAFLHRFPGLRALSTSIPQLRNLDFLERVPGLRDLRIHQAELEDISALRNHGNLDFFTAELNSSADVGVFRHLLSLKELNLGITGQESLDFIAQIPQLDRLTLRNLESIDDHSPLLSQESLTCLWLFCCPGLENVDVLPLSDSIEELCLTGSRLRCDLSEVVARAPRTRRLNIWDCQWVSSLEPLSDLHLENLVLGQFNPRVDLGPIFSHKGLRVLWMQGVWIRSLEPLVELTQLRDLYLKDCLGIESLAPLASLPSLRKLNIVDAQPGLDLSALEVNRKLTVCIREGQDVRNREALRGRITELSA
ncbi:NACHT domain-containing protein [Nocardiopsis sp. CC223A]|uniref:NACHT N-terminal Helical domain 1-containing protein n=1 Tax=Nocardiopsis sp. CC223A TaxID=3044051 RepID=UPI00278BDA8E|nr:NACHT domain-containing protein [Nocardiopsis sp. CC223A]